MTWMAWTARSQCRRLSASWIPAHAGLYWERKLLLEHLCGIVAQKPNRRRDTANYLRIELPATRLVKYPTLLYRVGCTLVVLVAYLVAGRIIQYLSKNISVMIYKLEV